MRHKHPAKGDMVEGGTQKPSWREGFGEQSSSGTEREGD